MVRIGALRSLLRHVSSQGHLTRILHLREVDHLLLERIQLEVELLVELLDTGEEVSTLHLAQLFNILYSPLERIYFLLEQTLIELRRLKVGKGRRVLHVLSGIIVCQHVLRVEGVL